MKINTIKYLIISLLIGLFACNNNKEVKVETSLVGIDLSEEVISYHNDLQNYFDQMNYNLELVKILNNNETVTNEKKCTGDCCFISNQESFKYLKKVYLTYSLLNDKKFNVNNTTFTDDVLQACDYLDSLKNLNAKDKDQVRKIKEMISTVRFSENEVIYYISEVYMNMLNSEYEILNGCLGQMNEEYIAKVKALPNTVFDEQKVAMQTAEPYTGKDVLINIYKLKLIQNAENEKKCILERLEKLLLAMETLNRANAEFAKKNPSLGEVNKYVEKTRILLENDEHQGEKKDIKMIINSEVGDGGKKMIIEEKKIVK